MFIENRNGNVRLDMTENSYKILCQMVTEAYMLRAKKFNSAIVQRAGIPDDEYYLIDETFDNGKLIYKLFRECGLSVDDLESPLLGSPDRLEPWVGDGKFLP